MKSAKSLGILTGLAKFVRLSAAAAIAIVATTVLATATPTITIPTGDAFTEGGGFGGTAPFTLVNLGSGTLPCFPCGPGNGNEFQSSSSISMDGETFSFIGGSPTAGEYAGNGSGFESPFSTSNGTQFYLASGVGGTVTETFSTPQTTLDLLWGSIDFSTQNQLAVTVDGYTINGSNIEAADPSFLSSCGSGNCSAYVEITGLGSFTTVTYTDVSGNVPNFEFVPGVPVTTSTSVPEPASIAMFGAAFFGLGLLGVLRRRKRSA